MGNDMTDHRATIVVPCYNEECRLDEYEFSRLAASGRVRLLFVNDGSTDGTRFILARLVATSEAIDLVDLRANAGKAEAVRRGLLAAIAQGASIIGYYDADLATPPHELLRLLEVLQADPLLTAVFGARLARLGSKIKRSPLRHYVGRIYATLASVALGITVYDTQCGAKVFRVQPAVISAVSIPFRSSWSFDVELCHRLLMGTTEVAGLSERSFVEVPLTAWEDVGGSKVRGFDGIGALLDLLAIGVSRIRNRHRGPPTTADPMAGVTPHDPLQIGPCLEPHAPRFRQLVSGAPRSI
jgi:hypothetical protein